MQSMASRLSMVLVPAMLLVLLLGGSILYTIIANHMVDEFIESLSAKARSVMALTEIEATGFEIEHLEISEPKFFAKIQPEYVLISTYSGVPLVSHPIDPEWWPKRDHTNAAETHFDNVPLPDGRNGFMISVLYLPLLDLEGYDKIPMPEKFEQKPLRLQVAVSREPLDGLLWSLKSVLFGVGLIIAASTVLLIKALSTYALKPLVQLSKSIGYIDETSLSTRINTDTKVAEINSLSKQFNHLLERLESAFKREQEFSSNVSHELRTPLAELTTVADIAERWPDDPSIRESFVDDVTLSAKRMTRVVESLLAISRCENNIEDLTLCNDLSEQVENTIQSLKSCIQGKNLVINWHPPDSIEARGEYQWQIIISNLIENAIYYSPEATSIDISLVLEDDDMIVFSISNEAPELSDRDLKHLFERFWRKDRARTSSEHSGIGLSLAHACVEQINAQIETSLDKSRFSIRVCKQQ